MAYNKTAQKKYYEKNKIERTKQHYQYMQNNPIYYIWSRSKNNAKTKGLEFTIEQKDIQIPTHCPYLNIKLTLELGKGRVESNMSLDRIDSTKGYIKDNIQVISDLANRMKQNATIEQLKTFAKNIDKLHA